MIRLLLVDDESMVVAHLTAILEPVEDIEVVGSANDGAEAVEAVGRFSPDIVLMDLRMPGVDGITAIERIATMPEPPVLVALTTFDVDSYVLRALRAGAAGFLIKSTPPDELIKLIRVAAAGHTVLAPEATRRLMAASRGGRQRSEEAKQRLTGLNERELDILACLGRGLSNADVAKKLHLSEATVKSYVSRLLDKVDCANRTQAGLLAQEAGLAD
ncbi:response regulator transcription factor [Amycolatopsis minnesotensis]|uniref:Response regulator transcription factor n=1 Tax=Amycolatopsis minnesotensis TaxID=337894 RepID=A0ABN2QH38_9PSEU